MYYLGLDIGTDSVGCAATDERYQLLRYKGEPIWVSHLFDPALQCADRRSYRTARRRLDRKQQRVRLVDEIFAKEVGKIDERFYIRRKESNLWLEDKSSQMDKNVLFNEEEWTDKEYYDKYPTIHHLIKDLMTTKEKRDIRLVNIAIDWLVAHRGHFLNEISEEHVDQIMDFKIVYEEFMQAFEQLDLESPWDIINIDELGDILKEKSGVTTKTNKLKKLLYNGKIPKDTEQYDKATLIKFLAGGKVKCKKLFPTMEYEEGLSMTISDDMDTLLPQLGENAELVAKMGAIYDWSILSDILNGKKYISEAKIDIYEQHRADLKDLKYLIKKYYPAKKKEILVLSKKNLDNYVAYVANYKSSKGTDQYHTTRDKFYAYLKKELKLEKLICEEADMKMVERIRSRIELGEFMPKQIYSDNRVIPYQLYFVELKKILQNMSKQHAFLLEKDEDGYSNIEKLLAIFKFKIPYFVGPLRKDNSSYAWIVRKEEGKIFPWNFEEKVDLDRSEQEFIDRMTNTCTYIPGKDVLPKWSVTYAKYMVLNEINNLKVNGVAISVKAKQGVYEELFCKRSKVTVKKIKDYLYQNGYMEKEDQLTGVDVNIKSSMRPLYEFRNLLDKEILSLEEIDEIIERSTYTEDRERYKLWLKKRFTQLSEEDLKYVSKLKYKDFGRLSKAFLLELKGADKQTGECGNIMYFLWNTNDNLMQILSGKYTFSEEITKARSVYYSQKKLSLADQLDEMGISNAVKRPVIRTIDVVQDIVSTLGYAPKKIFVEMARGVGEKGKRTVTRKEQILELYRTVDQDTIQLEQEIEEMGEKANNLLQRDELFLYYMQLGKCMYTGKTIRVEELGSGKYNIDHIYPQCYVKDDSVLNNKVLVLSEKNAEKGDKYPIDNETRQKMNTYWKMLCENNLITKEKYARLTRNTGFSEDEKLGFINRQLVETRQSTKAVTQVLNMLYPDTEIVFVKAKLATDFRQEFLTKKSRLVNDLHHAKDAYLNIVVGNVYNERFNKKWFQINEGYSVKVKTIFTRRLVHGDNVIWNAQKDLETVKRTFEKNNIHLTRYAYCKKGGLFDQNPLKASEGLTPLKKGLDTRKYGGYNKASAGFFILVKYEMGKKQEICFVPVELLVKERFLKDDAFAMQYIKDTLERIYKKSVNNIEILLDKRIIKIKTLLSLDGYLVWINGKANGGKIILLSNAISLKLSKEQEEYVRAIERFVEKKKDNPKLWHDERHDLLSEQKNEKLYDTIIEKMKTNIYQKMPGSQLEVIEEGKQNFLMLEFEQQLETLLVLVQQLKTGRTGGFEVKGLGKTGKIGAMTLNAKLTGTKYSCIQIIDQSPAGLHTKETKNLKEL